MRSRRSVLVTSLVVVFALSVPSGARAASFPKSMASTGDSITRAYNTGFFPYTDNPSASWSTGTSASVNSQYLRLLRLNPRIQGHNYNDAVSGAKMANLAGQMRNAVAQRVQYVTVLMGGNDLCTASVGTMTSVATFRSQLTTAMNTLTSGLPSVRVQVVSIPNAYHLWELFKDNFIARSVWAAFSVCQSLLADPLSTDAADVARRDAVRQRNRAFNDVLRDTCALYVQCRFDGYAVFNTVFAASDITGRDYFHPSTSGQAKLATVTWAAGYWPN
ncbi:MAG: SGNH/GDSL hydrolase family protein [Candidatus Limnocylindria bacterium]